jgi:hypothetical protein
MPDLQPHERVDRSPKNGNVQLRGSRRRIDPELVGQRRAQLAVHDQRLGRLT